MRSSSSHLHSLALFTCLSLSSLVVASEEVEVFAEVGKLLAPDGRASDEFGYSVSLDGDRLAVGTPEDINNDIRAGAVYLFERDADGSWMPVSKVLALDGQPHHEFGISVSLNGDRLAVGAQHDDDNGTNAGAAYVFEREDDGNWTQVSKLLALDGQDIDLFGQSVSLSGDRLAVGAYRDDDENGEELGSAYVFERNTEGRWIPESKLLAFDGQDFDGFGISVSLDGDRLAVGAHREDDIGQDSGSVYVFERDADGSWITVNKLVGGGVRDFFGSSVSLAGDRLAVGAEFDDDNGSSSGSAYVFERDAEGSWANIRIKLVPLDGQSGDNFGNSVSIDGDRLVVGAFGDDENGNNSGSAYVFEREVDGSWIEVSKLLALDGQDNDLFGHSVSLSGDRLAFGARDDNDNGNDSGSVFVFEPVLVSPRLTISGSCPGEIQLTSSGTTPRSRFSTYGSPSQGSWDFDRGPCVGSALDLDTPTPLRQTNSDFDAEGTLVRTVDASWCGTYLQVIDERTCLTSEVVQVPEARFPSP